MDNENDEISPEEIAALREWDKATRPKPFKVDNPLGYVACGSDPLLPITSWQELGELQDSKNISVYMPVGEAEATPATTILPELDCDDWSDAFGEGKQLTRYVSKECKAINGVSEARFTRRDVEKIYAMVTRYGTPNDIECYGLFRLKDGRYLSLESHCTITSSVFRWWVNFSVADSIAALKVSNKARDAYRDKFKCDYPANELHEVFMYCRRLKDWRYEILKRIVKI